VDKSDILSVKFGSDFYEGEVLEVFVDYADGQETQSVQVDMVFSDGELHQHLPLTGVERHAFMRATDEKVAALPPLLNTARTKTALKQALWYKGEDFDSTRMSMKVDAPILIIPDVHACSAFTSDQAGSLGGISVVLSAQGSPRLLDVVFTTTSGGNPDAMFVPIASAFAYGPAKTPSGVSFAPTSVIGFKLDFVGQTPSKRTFALIGDDDKPAANGAKAKLFVVPISTIKSSLSLPDWRVYQDHSFDLLIGSAILQAEIFSPLVKHGLLPSSPEVGMPLIQILRHSIPLHLH
jgi:hypothetical protein